MDFLSCPLCNAKFENRRKLSCHYYWCNKKQNEKLMINATQLKSDLNSNTLSDFVYPIDCNDSDGNIVDYTENNLEEDYDQETFLYNDNSILPDNVNFNILNEAILHEKAGLSFASKNESEYKAGVSLCKMLKDAKCPINMFDKIVNWAHEASSIYRVNFDGIKQLSRITQIEAMKKRTDTIGIAPHSTKLYLPGYKDEAEVIWHDFAQCLKSILQDDELMDESNILDASNMYEKGNHHHIYDDINSGTVFRNAYNIYIKDVEKEKLIPIIMFTDKTHTDMHGRLCLEPVQFTLGIFKRDVRNQPRAWRTLGYVTDLKYTGKYSSKDKMHDYHLILEVILKSFIECQKKPIAWHFMDKNSNQMKPFAMKIPVLFIIGDTDGHDKLCAKYGCRNKTVKRLCRYCNTPFDETSSSTFDYKLTKVSQIKTLIEKNEESKLNKMSFHCVKNIWHGVQFCDPIRNIYGATLAEVLHCMQQGIFEYAISILFEQKKEN
jgi:hypothetical protein